MKPETLEAIKKEALRLYPLPYNFDSDVLTRDMQISNDASECLQAAYTGGASTYAERLESEREKSEKLCEAVKSLLLICGHPTSEIYEDAKKVFDEYKTTSK